MRAPASSGAIPEPALAAFPRAVGAAKDFGAGFHAAADDFAPAMIAFGRDNLDRALEAIEEVRFPPETLPRISCRLRFRNVRI